jgi:hypothetical protein
MFQDVFCDNKMPSFSFRTPSLFCMCGLVSVLFPLYIFAGCGLSQMISLSGQLVYMVKGKCAKDVEMKRYCEYKKWQFRAGLFPVVGAMMMQNRFYTSQNGYEQEQLM